MARLPTLGLYVDGRPMTLARWPNQGFATGRFVAPPDGADGAHDLTIEEDRLARWAGASDAWLFGYWQSTWADGTMRIAAIDPKAKRITTVHPYIPKAAINPEVHAKFPVQFHAFNLLEEIDEPGEWYVDRRSGILYLYPPCDLAKATVEMPLLATALVTMDRVSHVRLEGLAFDLARENGIEITGGTGCLLSGCAITRLGGGGVAITGGANHGVLGCDISCLGRNGSWIQGGDRRTLQPSGHFVENCHIHDFSRIDRTYTPAVWVDGVGTRIAHNLFHDTPCHAIRLEGNDHLVEYNEFHSVVRESDDQGAIDIFGNPTYRGMVFRYNWFHHIGGEREQLGGIRFDDAISGLVVHGNLFHRSSYGHFGAVQLNCGRENVIENNVMIDGAYGVSGGWTPGWSEGNAWWQAYYAGTNPDHITSELYHDRYPTLKSLHDQLPNNYIWRNILVDCGKPFSVTPSRTDLMENVVYARGEDPGFVDAARGDYRLKDDAAVFARLAFRPIPVEEIGLYPDEHRATWPVVSTPKPVPDWR